MRARLVDGKIPEPASEVEALLRHQQVAHAIAGIEDQIGRGRAQWDRQDWLSRARGNLGWLKSEERQLRAWIEARGAEILPPRAREAEPSKDDYSEG